MENNTLKPADPVTSQYTIEPSLLEMRAKPIDYYSKTKRKSISSWKIMRLQNKS